MSLSQRRQNAPNHLGPMPVFQLETPNRTLHRLVSLPSVESLASIDSLATRNTLPEYEAQVDDNPDVITTSVEIDPDCEDDDDDIADEDRTPSTEVKTPTNVNSQTISKVKRRDIVIKKAGLSKLFAKSTIQKPIQSPGVRLTRLPQMLKTRSKDPRSGFSLAPPELDDAHSLNIDSEEWMLIVSRINILLAAGQTNDVQPMLDAYEKIQDRVSFMKVSEAKHMDCDTLDVPTPIPFSRSLGTSVNAMNFLAVPELNPGEDDCEDGSSLYSRCRRGSSASSVSTASSVKSSLSQRIRERFDKKEEWCLVFE